MREKETKQEVRKNQRKVEEESRRRRDRQKRRCGEKVRQRDKKNGLLC